MLNPSETSDPIEDNLPREEPSRRRLRPRLVIACIALGLVLGGGAALATWRFSTLQADSTPLPRPWIDAPFITTPMDVVDKMLEIAEVNEDDLLYDLGCGDGRIVVTAAEKYGCRGKGFDIDPERIRESRENARLHDVEHLVAFEQKDIFTLDLSKADVVTMYLLPTHTKKLIPQLAQMRPGSRIVSHDFLIEGVPPDETIHMTSEEDEHIHAIYLWIAPIKTPQETP